MYVTITYITHQMRLIGIYKARTQTIILTVCERIRHVVFLLLSRATSMTTTKEVLGTTDTRDWCQLVTHCTILLSSRNHTSCIDSFTDCLSFYVRFITVNTLPK